MVSVRNEIVSVSSETPLRPVMLTGPTDSRFTLLRDPLRPYVFFEVNNADTDTKRVYVLPAGADPADPDAWEQASVLFADSAPLAASPTAVPGSANQSARSDHQHPSPEAIAYYTDAIPGNGPSDTSPLLGMMNAAKTYGFAFRWRTNGGMELFRRANNVDTLLMSAAATGSLIFIGGSPWDATSGAPLRVNVGTYQQRLAINGANGGNPVTVSVASSVNAGLYLSSALEAAVTIRNANRDAARFYAPVGSVNCFALLGSATGQPIILQPQGSDTDASVRVEGKGAGGVIVGNTTDKLTFFNGALRARPTVTGNKSTNLQAVVTSLLAALGASGLNLIDDQTT